MSPAALSARRIGEILCEKGLLTHEQLEDALAEQERTERRFGEILLERGLVSRLALASALAEQWATLEGEHATIQQTSAEEDEQVETLDAIEEEWQALRGRHRPIGEIFVAGGLISQEQLDRALEEQKRTGQRLGEVLVAHGAVSRLELASALAEQWAARPRLRLAEDEAAEAAPKENGSAPAPKEANLANQRIEELAGRLEQHDESFLSAAQELESRLAGLEQLVNAAQDGDGLGSELEELRRSLAELRERDLDGSGIGREELDSVLETRIGPLDERLTSFGEAAERLGADLRGAVERLGVRLDEEAQRLEDVATRHAREAAEARLAEEAAARATIEAAVEERLAALEELTALSGEDRRIVELASDLGDLRSAVNALTDRPAGESSDATQLEARIAALEERLTQQRESDDARGQAAASALEQLRDRVDTQAHESAAVLEQRLAEIEARLAERSEAARAEGSAQLDGRLDGIEAKLTELSEAEQALDGSLATALQEIQEKLREEAQRLAKVVSEHADAGFDRRLAELEERIAAAGDEDPRLAELVAEVAQLGSELDALRNRGQEQDGPLGEIHAKLEALEKRVAAPAEDDPRVADLSADVAHLGNELDALRNSARPDEGLGARVAELELRVSTNNEEDPRLAQLAAEMEELTRQLDALPNRGQELEGPLAEIHGKLEAPEERVAGPDEDDPRLVNLSATVAQLGNELGARVAELEQRVSTSTEEDQSLAQLAAEVEDLARQLDALRDTERPDDELRARVDALQAQIGEAAETGLAQVKSELDHVRHELDALRKQSTGDKALERLAELERTVSSADESDRIEALQAELADVRGSIEALSSRAGDSDELHALEERLAELHAKVDAAAGDAVSAAEARVAELEQQIAARAPA